MNHLLIIASIFILLTTTIAFGQYPGEECRWECEVIYCDYYYDYCDYDCHEVCYPYSPQDPLSSASRKVSNNQWLHNAPQSISLGSLKMKLQQSQPVLKNIEQLTQKQAVGDVVKMRIQNPSFQVMRGQELIAARGSPPVGLAIFQNCLSAKNKAQTPMWNTSDRSNDQKGIKL